MTLVNDCCAGSNLRDLGSRTFIYYWFVFVRSRCYRRYRTLDVGLENPAQLWLRCKVLLQVVVLRISRHYYTEVNSTIDMESDRTVGGNARTWKTLEVRTPKPTASLFSRHLSRLRCSLTYFSEPTDLLPNRKFSTVNGVLCGIRAHHCNRASQRTLVSGPFHLPTLFSNIQLSLFLTTSVIQIVAVICDCVPIMIYVLYIEIVSSYIVNTKRRLPCLNCRSYRNAKQSHESLSIGFG